MRPGLWTCKTLNPRWRIFAFNWVITRIGLQLVLIRTLIYIVVRLCGYPRLRFIMNIFPQSGGIAIVLIFHWTVLNWSLFWKSIINLWSSFSFHCRLLVSRMQGNSWFTIMKVVRSLIGVYSCISERVLVVVMIMVMVVHWVEVLHSFLCVYWLILEINFKLIVLFIIIIANSNLWPGYAFWFRHCNFNFLASLDWRNWNSERSGTLKALLLLE